MATKHGELDGAQRPRSVGTDLVHACALCGQPVVDREASGIYLHRGPAPTHPACARREGVRMIAHADEVEPARADLATLRALARTRFQTGTLVRYRGLDLSGVVMDSDEVDGDVVIHVGWHYKDHDVREAHRIPARVSITHLDTRERA